MFFLVGLLILIVALSFVLSYRSMLDFEDPITLKADCGLFLIRARSALTKDLFDLLYDQIAANNTTVAIERLIKGGESAIVIFGPKDILENFNQRLDLLELEDYTQGKEGKVLVWEFVPKSSQVSDFSGNIFKKIPQLLGDEQFFWQLVFRAHKNLFKVQIRAGVYSIDLLRREQLAANFQSSSNSLIKNPKPYSMDKMFEYYKNRSLIPNKYKFLVKGEQILNLLQI